MSNLRGLFVPVCLVIAWGAAVQMTGVTSDTIVSPDEVARCLGRLLWDGSLAARTGQTLLSAVVGLALGAVLGLLGGIALGLAPKAAGVLQAPIELLRPL